MRTQGSKHRIKPIQAVHNLRMDHVSKQNLSPLFCFIFLLNFITCGVRSSIDELKRYLHHHGPEG